MNTKIVNIIISEEIKMKKSIFKNIKVEEIIKSMESKFFTIFKRYDAGNLNISLSYINKPDIFYEKQIYGNNTEIIPASIIKLFTIDYFLHVLKDHNLLNSTTSTTVGEEINNKYVNKYLFKVGLKRGEKYRIIDLIDLAIIPSASDAVYVLSRFVYNVLFGISLNDSSFISNFDDWEWMLLRISQGSIMRIDKERRENIGMALAKMGLIDPYNLFKDLGLKDADKRYEALVKFKMAPDTLVADVKSEVADRDAYIDFSLIMNGQEAQPRDDITPDHIHAHRKQLMTDKFLYAKPEYQQAMLQHIEQEVIGLSQRAKLEVANEQGMLIDPSLPITPEPPEVPPPMPQPPMMPPQGMPPNGAPIPPMPDAGAMPPQGEAPIPQMPEGGAGIPDVGVLSGLMGA